MNRIPFRLNSVLLALLMGANTFSLSATAQAQTTNTAAAPRDYDLPGGPLANTLNRIAREAGLSLTVDAALLADKNAAPVRGRFDAAEALRRALSGSGLELLRTELGGFTIRTSAAPSPAATPASPAAATEATLPTVVVKASRESESAISPVRGFVASRSASATKTDTPLQEIPQSISVVGRDELESRGARDMQEAVRYTPGVVVGNWGIDNRSYEWILLRGFDASRTSSYRDGLPQALFVNNNAPTEMYGIERVEVLRGPSSVMFGQGEVGGIINRISKRPPDSATREVELRVGSYENRQIAADVGGPIDDEAKLAYRLIGLGMDSNSELKYTDGNDVEAKRLYLAPSLRWRPTPATSVTLLSEILDDKSGDDGSYLVTASGQPTDVLEGEPAYSRIKQRSASGGYELEHALNGNWKLRQNFRIAHRDADKHHMRALVQANGTVTRTARRDEDIVDQASVDTHVQGRVTTGPIGHTLLLGMDWDKVKGKETTRTGPAPSLNLFNPVYGQPVPEPATLAGDYTQTTRQLGFYAQDQMKFGERWIFTLGGRQDRVESLTENRFNNTRTERDDIVFSGRAGITWLASNGLAPYASYAESFLPQSGVNAAGQAFQPTRGKQYEIGIKYRPQGMRAQFSAAVFDLSKTDVVTFDEITAVAQQVGKIRSRGIELEARAELARGLQGIASYTRQDVKVTESNNDLELDKTPIQIPDQMASLWVDYAFPEGALKGWGVGGGVRYIGKRWNNAINTSHEPGYSLADAAIHYQGDSWRASLNANNLFDRHYYASRAFNGYYRGSGRSWLASVKYWF